MDSKIFVNRALQMKKIKFVGFDMDATLAIYKSPVSERLAFEHGIEHLVRNVGYPKELLKKEYNPGFPMRGAWFDKEFGTLIKADEHSNIMDAWFGTTKMTSEEIRRLYPNKHLLFDDQRIFVLNTVFNTPEVSLLANVVDVLKKYGKILPDHRGFAMDSSGQLLFRTVQKHCRGAIDASHDGPYKPAVMADMLRYIVKDPRAKETMIRLKKGGKTTFLLTNSPWKFTDCLMGFIMGNDWQKLFDVVIVAGDKPSWFSSSTPFREVDLGNGKPQLWDHVGPFKAGSVYQGGNVNTFTEVMGCVGKDVLYVGDHIFGDVLRSKRVNGWRTLLIVPELEQEVTVWTKQQQMFTEMTNHANLEGGGAKEKLKKMAELTREMEKEHGEMGSVLRCGWKHTYYAAQIRRYADIYTGNVYNMVSYPPDHYFHCPLSVLPHEEHHHAHSNMPDAEFKAIGASPSEMNNNYDSDNLEMATSK